MCHGRNAALTDKTLNMQVKTKKNTSNTCNNRPNVATGAENLLIRASLIHGSRLTASETRTWGM